MSNTTKQDYTLASADLAVRPDQVAREAIAVRVPLARFCARLLHSETDGEDAAHDALVQALRKAGALRAGTPIRPWLFRIARNRCIDVFRKRKRHAEADHSLARTQETCVKPCDARLQVREALVRTMTLARRERQCLLLRDVLGETLAETSGALGIPVGAVKAALHRARCRLRSEGRGVPMDAALLARYVDAFDREDFGGLAALVISESGTPAPAKERPTPSVRLAA